MAQNKVWFIDANILVHWVLGKGEVLNFLIDKFHLNNEFFNIYSKRYEDSISFIEELRKSRSLYDANEFYVSHLAMNELFSGLKDELRSIILFKNGVPISRWRDSRNNPEITSTDYEAIYKTTLKSFDILFGKKAIEYIDEQSLEDNPNYFDIYSSILFLVKEAKTQDSTLLTTAILNRADYFVTKDEVLIKSAKNIIKDGYNLDLIKPAHAVQILHK
ncbi:MAG: hypothetical protein O8C64_14525 [Candidatus Methanoperedens sp.]|nr:hypothetical protein [Candidatus Methanoperedens sp.]MCZ7404660.1 hypothetical protein [Candidatus Methanoperedens sp.]